MIVVVLEVEMVKYLRLGLESKERDQLRLPLDED